MIHLVADPGDKRTVCGRHTDKMPEDHSVGWAPYAQRWLENGVDTVCNDCLATGVQFGWEETRSYPWFVRSEST